MFRLCYHIKCVIPMFIKGKHLLVYFCRYMINVFFCNILQLVKTVFITIEFFNAQMVCTLWRHQHLTGAAVTRGEFSFSNSTDRRLEVGSRDKHPERVKINRILTRLFFSLTRCLSKATRMKTIWVENLLRTRIVSVVSSSVYYSIHVDISVNMNVQVHAMLPSMFFI